MIVKTKKKNPDGILKFETSGEVKEIFVNEDIFKPEEALVSVCFRGEISSGIIELSLKEIKGIYKSVMERADLLKDVKVIKFKK